MKIVAKSVIKTQEMLNKMKYGADSLEIQLQENFVENVSLPGAEAYVLSEASKIIEVANMVTSVHAPLCAGADVNIEMIPFYEEVIVRTCMLADLLAVHYNTEVTVVLHNGLTLDAYMKQGNLLQMVTAMFRRIIKEYTHIDFAIENITPIRKIKEVGLVFRGGGYGFDNVVLARYLNDMLMCDKFGTVLDTCHALTTLRVFNLIYPNEIEKYSLLEFFKANQKLVKVVHVCDVRELGLEDKTHGIIFQDKVLLEKVMQLMKVYTNDKTDYVLEILEEDYSDAVNFKQLRLDMLEIESKIIDTDEQTFDKEWRSDMRCLSLYCNSGPAAF